MSGSAWRTTIGRFTRCVFILGLVGNVYPMPDIPKWEITPSIGFGSTILQGPFSDFYKPGYEVNLGFFIPTGKFNIFMQPTFSFGSFPFRTDSASKMNHYDAGLPLGIYWQAFAGITPFIAAGPEFSYYRLSAASSGLASTAYRIKPMASAGLFVPVNYFSFITIGARYSYTQLSEETFGNVTLTAAFTLSYPAWRRNTEAVERALLEQSRQQQIRAETEDLMLTGQALMKDGAFDEAEQKFREVLRLKSDHAGARGQIDTVRAMPFLKEARELREEGKGVSAIRSYERASHLEEARKELAEYRAQLRNSLPALVKSATDAYNAGQYVNAIAIFEKVQAIDPENDTAKIYLPRARNRQKAIDRLN